MLLFRTSLPRQSMSLINRTSSSMSLLSKHSSILAKSGSSSSSSTLISSSSSSLSIRGNSSSPSSTTGTLFHTSNPRHQWADWWPHEPNRPHSPQLNPYFMELEANTRYLWCSCGRSNTQPFCDGSHKGTGYKPFPFQVNKRMSQLICGCKYTEYRPYCNFTHLYVSCTQHLPQACAAVFGGCFVSGIVLSFIFHP